MFPLQIWLAYTFASVLIVLAPGPDMVLSIARGLSQGKTASILSGLGAGTGILFHSIAATYGLAMLLQASAVSFLIVKILGASYLILLGAKALLYRDLVTFAAGAGRPLHIVFLAGLTSNVMNPKIALFVLAFIPQFTSAERGRVDVQMLVYGAWLAVLAAVGLSLIGSFASELRDWLKERPRFLVGINVGAGLAFVGTGLSAAAVKGN